MQNLKIKNKTKKIGGLFVLSTFSLISSFITSVYPVDKYPAEYVTHAWNDSGTWKEWIRRSRYTYLTENQINSINSTFELPRDPYRSTEDDYRLRAHVKGLNNRMMWLRTIFNEIWPQYNSSSSQFYKNYIKDPSYTKKGKIERLLIDAQKFMTETDNTGFYDIEKIGNDIIEAWNNLDGFAKLLKERVSSKRSLTNAQKSALNLKIDALTNSKKGNVKNNVNTEYFNSVKANEKLIDDLDTAMQQLKATINEYKAKKIDPKYVYATPRTKNSFDNAITNGENITNELNVDAINNLRQEIINKFNLLDGSDKKIKLKQKLSTAPFNEWNAATIKTIEDEIDAATTDSQLDNLSNKLDTVGEEYTNAKASLQELEEYKTDRSSEADYRLADEDKKADFNTKLADLKNRLDNAKSTSGTDFWNNTSKSDFGAIATAAETAKNNLNGRENKAEVERIINDSLTNIDDTTKSEAETKIGNAAETPNKAALEKIKNDLQAANDSFDALKNKLKEYTDQIGKVNHNLATDYTRIDNEVINALNLVMDAPKLDLISNSTNLEGRKLIATTGAQVQEAINSINTSIGKLNGEENLKNQKQEKINEAKTAIEDLTHLSTAEKKTFTDKLYELNINDATETLTNFQTKITPIKTAVETLDNLNKAKANLKAKLKINPLDKLNATTIAAIEAKIDAITAIDQLTPIETQATELASKIDDLKSEIVKMKAAQATENYTLASADKKSAFEAALATLEAKVNTDNIYDETATTLQGFVREGAEKTAALDGLLNKRKQESRDKLTTSPLVELNTATKSAIEAAINNATNNSELDSLDSKALNIAEAFKTLKDKVAELEPYKSNADYKLADDAAPNNYKGEFDTNLAALKNELTKTTSILDENPTTINNLVTSAIKAKDDLNGKENLEAVKKEIADNLNHLSSSQKTQATNNVSDLTKVDSKAALKAAETLFTNINSELGKAKTTLDGVSNLKPTEKTTFLTNLEAIDISDLTEDQAKVKINEITLEAKKTGLINVALNEVDGLSHLDDKLIEKIKTKLNDFDKTNTAENETTFKDKIDEILNKAKTLNDKFGDATSGIVKAFNDYVATVGTTKYDEATNKDEQNNIVYSSLSKVFTPTVTAPSPLTNTENIDTLKIGSGIEDASKDLITLLNELNNNADDAVTKINKAKTDLNGETVLADNIAKKKKELSDLINDASKFGELAQDVKDTILATINGVGNTKADLDKLNDLEPKINAAAEVVKKLNEKIADLEAKKTDKNYKLADDANQKAFDKLIDDLKEQLKEDLFDNAKKDVALNLVNTTTDTLANSKLNGNDNLLKAIETAKKLDNLSSDQKTQAETKLNDFDKINDRAKLQTAESTLVAIDSKLKVAKDTINDLPHLTKATKDKAIENLGKIDITNLTSDQAQAAIDNIVNPATTLNTSLEEKLTKLKEVLKKYTDTISSQKHDVTQNVNNIDQAILDELKKVLADITDTALSNTYNIDGKKLKTNDLTALDNTISYIETALTNLNGDTEITKVTDKLAEDTWNNLNDATKNSIRTAAEGSASYDQLQEVVTKANQAVTDNETIKNEIANMKAIKDSPNYKLAEPAKKAEFDAKLIELETKLTSEDLYNKTPAEMVTILEPLKNAHTALDGDNNKTKALADVNGLTNIPESTQRNSITSKINNLAEIDSKDKLDKLVAKFSAINTKIGDANTEIEKLDHLSQELQNEFKTKIANIDVEAEQSATETKIQTLVTEAQAINSKFDELKTAVANYKSIFPEPKYTEATAENKTTQNDKVKTALESVLKDKTYSNVESDLEELTNETYKTGTTLASAEQAINKIKDALASLNGLSQVEEEKDKVKAKVNDADGIYNKLNDDTKNAILADLDKPENDTKAEINAIDTKASQALDVSNNLAAKIAELKEYKDNKDYKLSNPDKKQAFDAALAKLEEQVSKNLFDDTIRAETEAAIDAANNAKDDLNGNENLAAAKTIIDGLTHLLSDTKTAIATDLDNIAKYRDKEALDAATAKFSAIDTKVGETVTNIDNLEHLSQVAKDTFIAEAKTIETNEGQATIEAKIAAVEAKATNVDSKYGDLKAAYDAYKAEMTKANYVDATESIKTAQDQKVTYATASVLDATTAPGPTQDLLGDIKTNISAEQVEAATEQIRQALSALDGNENLADLKEKVTKKTEADGEFSTFSEATKNAIKQEVTDAEFMAQVNDVDQKATAALDTLKEIDETIKALEAAKATTNYSVANPEKQQALDAVLKRLQDLKATNLLEATAKTQSTEDKIEAEKAIAALNGDQNLKAAQDKVDTFIHIPKPQRDQARDNLPTTSLADLNQRVKDLEEMNKAIEVNKEKIDKLVNLNETTKDELKEEVANIDLSKPKNENIENSNKVVETAVDLNARFAKFKTDLDNYLSVKQTPTFTAATNKADQDAKIVNLINSILSSPVSDVSQVTTSNTFKHGLNAAQVDATLAAIQTAIAELNGNREVENAKTNTIEEISTTDKYKTLSTTNKQNLEEMINKVQPNQNDWKTRLVNATFEANKMAQISNKPNSEGDSEVTPTNPETSQIDTKPQTPPTELKVTTNNKLYWLFSLLAIIPISIFWFILGKRRKNKKDE
ncbi:hypothetical protein ACW95P_01220 [Candidatus Mycoplasma pogonae]